MAFYNALGWSGAQQPDDEIAFFQTGGMVFGLWTALGGHGAPGIELAHNVRSPEEVDALLAAAQRAGATIVRPAARPSGVATPAPSPTSTVTSGKWRTTLIGSWPTTALFACRRRKRDRRRLATAAVPSCAFPIRPSLWSAL